MSNHKPNIVDYEAARPEKGRKPEQHKVPANTRGLYARTNTLRVGGPLILQVLSVGYGPDFRRDSELSRQGQPQTYEVPAEPAQPATRVYPEPVATQPVQPVQQPVQEGTIVETGAEKLAQVRRSVDAAHTGQYYFNEHQRLQQHTAAAPDAQQVEIPPLSTTPSYLHSYPPSAVRNAVDDAYAAEGRQLAVDEQRQDEAFRELFGKPENQADQYFSKDDGRVAA